MQTVRQCSYKISSHQLRSPYLPWQNDCNFRYVDMFITAVCVLFLVKLRWPKNKSLSDLPSAIFILRNTRGRLGTSFHVACLVMHDFICSNFFICSNIFFICSNSFFFICSNIFFICSNLFCLYRVQCLICS